MIFHHCTCSTLALPYGLCIGTVSFVNPKNGCSKQQGSRCRELRQNIGETMCNEFTAFALRLKGVIGDPRAVQ